jgi:transposase-like protein
MALSDSQREQLTVRKRNRAIEANTNMRWSDKQKVEAATTYLAIGNLAQTARILGIPEITLRVWKATNWWNELIEELKSQERMELSRRLKNIVDAAHTVVENRLVNGDPIIHPKTGDVMFKPVNMRDAHRVAVDLQNQREAVEKLNKPVEEVEVNQGKLEQLAEKFAEFATKAIVQIKDKQRTIDVVDVIPREETVNAEMAQDDPVPDEVLSPDGFEGTEDLVQKEQNSTSSSR